ncbi:twin-arginine translocation signal domain-containing protein [Vibrio sonorensis]|uniref:twin-arginine translocation signal domain-containing protein n=1 Tax=Vibrio sonorensis TaxID=1004316 RepID=UPI0008D9564E|nr:twin-arginine translocation signal domain-containing protein [Vibrio sonorensis]
MTKQQKPDSTRRNLLKGIAGAAAAGAMAGTVQATSENTKPIEDTGKESTGYRETQHVKDYYDTL